MPVKRVIPRIEASSRVEAAILASRYERDGADELFVFSASAHTWAGELARVSRIPIAIGSNVSSVEDIRRLLRAGADKAILQAPALARPGLLEEAAKAFGRQRIIAAVETAQEGTLAYLAGLCERGAGEILLHSTSWDLPLLEAASQLPIPLIAGPADTVRRILQAFQHGADGAIPALPFEEGLQSIQQLKRTLAAAGCKVRP